MVNLVDFVGIVFYLLIAYIIYKKNWFYSFYSFIKFIVIALVSLFISNFISARNPINLPVTKLEQSLILELLLFVCFWRFLNFKRPFFKSAKKVDRFIFVHGLNKFLNLVPALVASLFITFFLFTSLVSASTNSVFLQRELEKSNVVKGIAYKIYGSKIFEGVAVKLDIPSTPNINISLEGIRRAIVYGVLRRGVMTVKTAFDPYFTIPAMPTAGPLPTIPPPNGTRGNEFEPSPTVIIKKWGIPSGDSRGQNPNPNTPNTIPTATPVVEQNPNPQNPPQQNPQPQPNPQPQNTDISQIEQDIFRLTNEQRTKNGLPAFAWSERLASVARAHSQDMDARNFFAHTNPDGKDPFARMRSAGISFSTAGENIAGGANADIIVTNWMNSPGHRANILNPSFHTLGVGVSTNSRYGLLATQNFTN